LNVGALPDLSGGFNSSLFILSAGATSIPFFGVTSGLLSGALPLLVDEGHNY